MSDKQLTPQQIEREQKILKDLESYRSPHIKSTILKMDTVINHGGYRDKLDSFWKDMDSKSTRELILRDQKFSGNTSITDWMDNSSNRISAILKNKTFT